MTLHARTFLPSRTHLLARPFLPPPIYPPASLPHSISIPFLYIRIHTTQVVEFEFSPSNPFFTNRILRKGLLVLADPETRQVTGAREECSDIEWADGRSLLVREVAGGGGGGGGKVCARGRTSTHKQARMHTQSNQ